MTVFKCKMCGGSLDIAEGMTTGECDYCGTKQTFPRLDDDRRVNLYDRANHFRRNNDFDKAAGIYEQILNEDTNDAEAYWSIVLCRYGIEYVEDPASHRRLPTVNRTQFTSVFDDEDYKSALEHADAYQRAIYEEEAKTINDIQKGILAISKKEKPFDVFICYKETDNNGHRTEDSVLANDLYHQLTQEEFKVFFSRITLEDKLGTAYEPYIFAALNSAKVMVVLGTKQEYFNAVWVKNEWSRFLSIVSQSGGKKVLIPAYKDMDPYDLPEEFSHLQAQDMSKLGFMQDLIRGIKKIVKTEKPESVQKQEVVREKANVEPLLKRVFLFLEDKKWEEADKYCERVLDQDPENAQAYLGKLLVEYHVTHLENLKNRKTPLSKSDNYKKAIRFGDESFVAKLNEYNDNVNYNYAVIAMNNVKTPDDCISVAKLFQSISGYKDSDTLATKCLTKKEELENKIKKEKEEKRIKEKERKKEIEAIVDALKLGESDMSFEEVLKISKTKLNNRHVFLNVFNELQEKLLTLNNEQAALLSQENSIHDQRLKLGLFTGKERRRLLEELSKIAEKKQQIAASISQTEKQCLGYTSKEEIEREIAEEKAKVYELEKVIKKNNEKKYSFNEALELYRNDSNIAIEVDRVFPKARFISSVQ